MEHLYKLHTPFVIAFLAFVVVFIAAQMYSRPSGPQGSSRDRRRERP